MILLDNSKIPTPTHMLIASIGNPTPTPTPNGGGGSLLEEYAACLAAGAGATVIGALATLTGCGVYAAAAWFAPQIALITFGTCIGGGLGITVASAIAHVTECAFDAGLPRFNHMISGGIPIESP